METTPEQPNLTPDEQRGMLRGVHTFLRDRVARRRKRVALLHGYVRQGQLEGDEREVAEAERSLEWAIEDFRRIEQRMTATDNFTMRSIVAASRLRGEESEVSGAE